MEKIPSLTSSDVPHDELLFKNHLAISEKGWIGEGEVSVETYRSTLSRLLFSFSTTLTFDPKNKDKITQLYLLIPTGAQEEEIEAFLKIAFRDEILGNLSPRRLVFVVSSCWYELAKGRFAALVSDRATEATTFPTARIMVNPPEQFPDVAIPQGSILPRSWVSKFLVNLVVFLPFFSN